MFGVLDLDWVPTSPAIATPPRGHGNAIVRGDDYSHVYRITDGWADLGGFTYRAQIRKSRLKGAAITSPLLASFDVVTSQDGADLLITLSLSNEITLSLFAVWWWDLQVETPAITTLVQGKGKTVDDVTREP